MEMPIYDCTSFYWPEELSLKNCMEMVPSKAEEINANFEKQGLKIHRMQINCVKSNSIPS
tara:strand:+ start:369 stop:548 length:180 start_codon:yes stop_codon:yes gene_type:complete